MSIMNEILPLEREEALRRPIDGHIGKIQEKIDELRKDGTDQVQYLKNHIQRVIPAEVLRRIPLCRV